MHWNWQIVSQPPKIALFFWYAIFISFTFLPFLKSDGQGLRRQAIFSTNNGTMSVANFVTLPKKLALGKLGGEH